MKKFLPIVIILLLVGGGGYFLVKGKISLKGVPGLSKTGESLSGSLKLMMEKGLPLRCSYKVDENNFGTGYLKGKKYAAEVSINGQKSKVLLIENCMYTWNEAIKEAMGSKICFQSTEEKNVWDMESGVQGNYNCSPAVFSDSVFEIPTDIKFLDVGQMPSE